MDDVRFLLHFLDPPLTSIESPVLVKVSQHARHKFGSNLAQFEVFLEDFVDGSARDISLGLQLCYGEMPVTLHQSRNERNVLGISGLLGPATPPFVVDGVLGSGTSCEILPPLAHIFLTETVTSKHSS